MSKIDPVKLKVRIEKARLAKQRNYVKHLNNLESKRSKTLFNAVRKVKDVAETSLWSSSHDNCFRCTVGKGESPRHIKKKFERWLYWREFGATVFTELRLKNGRRPDLIVCLNNGDVFIEEIVESEKEKSIIDKRKDYPFEIRAIE